MITMKRNDLTGRAIFDLPSYLHPHPHPNEILFNEVRICEKPATVVLIILVLSYNRAAILNEHRKVNYAIITKSLFRSIRRFFHSL